jgi:tetratricopeptide (TPR) repeat protein
VSAVFAPKSGEPVDPASDADGWALLEALRRRLDEQVAQGRKTQAQVGQLADSIAALVAQQRRRSLWLNVNSFVAYLMFTLLCVTGFYLLYRSRAHELSGARDQAIAERDAAVRRSDEATVRAVAREAAGNKAWEIYELLEAGKRADAVAKLEAVHDQPLSRTERAVLAARIHDTHVMEVDAALKTAVAAIKAGRPADAIRPLEAALIGEPPGSRAAVIHYYLGVADVDQDDARFQLASVLDRSGSYAQARAEYDRFATAHPQSPLAMFAMRRSATLARFPATAPPPPAAIAPQPAAPNAPAPSPRLPAGPGAQPLPAAPRQPVGPSSGVAPAPGAGARVPGNQPWLKPPVKPQLPSRPPAPNEPVDPGVGPGVGPGGVPKPPVVAPPAAP